MVVTRLRRDRKWDDLGARGSNGAYWGRERICPVFSDGNPKEIPYSRAGLEVIVQSGSRVACREWCGCTRSPSCCGARRRFGRGRQAADSRETAKTICDDVSNHDALIFAVDWWESVGRRLEKDVKLKFGFKSETQGRRLVTSELRGGASRQVRVEGRNALTTLTVSRMPAPNVHCGSQNLAALKNVSWLCFFFLFAFFTANTSLCHSLVLTSWRLKWVANTEHAS